MNSKNPYRDLPGVDELASEFADDLPWPLLAAVAREVISQARGAIGEGSSPDVRGGMDLAIRALRRSAGVRVINATGVMLHTNMGRARQSVDAARAARSADENYTNLELDLATGERGRRGHYLGTLLTSLTGAEDTLVLNNNAGAVVLALAALAGNKAVPVSRGELIEIGGAYRLPDVMNASGARLVEVGTTNRTRLGDYETALQVHDCGAVLKVHTSNYTIEGFTTETDTDSLAALAKSRGLPLIHDIGSGLLDETTPWLDGPTPEWLSGEPGATQSVQQGADVVTFSGDKLLGGPQSGIVVGTSRAIQAMRAHPLARALRVDGSTLASLQVTLEAYAKGDTSTIPFWQMATRGSDEIRARADRLAERIGGRVVPGDSAIGAGSAPSAAIPSAHLILDDEDHLYERLLGLDTPIVARRDSGALVLDLRTVEPTDDDEVADGLIKCR